MNTELEKLKSQIVLKDKKINSLETKILCKANKKLNNISCIISNRKKLNNSCNNNSGFSFEKKNNKVNTCLRGLKMQENLEKYKKLTNERASQISFNNDLEIGNDNLNYLKKNKTPIKRIQIYNKYGNLADYLKNEQKKINTKKNDRYKEDIQNLSVNYPKNKSFSNSNIIDKLDVNVRQDYFNKYTSFRNEMINK